MKRTLTTLTIAVTLAALTPPANAGWILPPEAASTVTAAVGIAAKPDKAGVLRSATLDKTRIGVVARRGENVILSVTLVHPSEAPADAFQAAGVALLESPGPVDQRQLKALQARLKNAKQPVPWREIDEEPAEPSQDAKRAVETQLRKGAYLLSAGDDAEARSALKSLPSSLAPHDAIRAAVLWKKLDAPKAVEAALAGLGAGTSPSDAAARAIKGEKTDPTSILAKAQGEAACAFNELSRVLTQLDRREEARAMAEAVLARAKDCPAAWEAALHRRLEAKDLDKALTLADAARERFPPAEAPDGLVSTIASAYVAHKRFADASELLELVARRTPTDESVIRVLLSAMLRDAKLREMHTNRLEAQRTAMPEDIITRFLLGIVYHYANRFEESSALLLPLEAELGHQGRLHIYLAMNDFNQGKIAPALSRLDKAATGTDPDPDIFYCRAEILRDTKREQAHKDLARYRAMSRGSHMSNPEKSARVDKMIADLDTCLRDNVPVCASSWEHPRLRKRKPPQDSLLSQRDDEPPRKGEVSYAKPLTILGLVLAVLLWMWRRRTRP